MSQTPTAALQVPIKLRELFTGKLAEADSNNTEQQNEANFLSRSLAAYAVHKLSGCSLQEAADSVVDGGGDAGIDALFYSPAARTMWVVQSKYIRDGQGQPALKEVNSFVQGLTFLLEGKFNAFSQNKGKAWNQIAPQLESIFKNVEQVRSVLVYSGINVISDDRLFLFEDVKTKFNAEDDEYVDFHLCNLTRIHDWLVGADEGVGVEQVDLTVINPSWTKRPYETVLGLIPLRDLAQLYADYGRALVAANIRYYKGKTDVNEQIMRTICEEPEHFFYLNNGLTAYCDRLSVHNLDRNRMEYKRITTKCFSIVNGAQTLGSIAEFLKSHSTDDLKGSVFIKVISLERCEDDRKFAERITHSTNFQNQIGSRDFVALDEQQERIASELKLSGIAYHYKDDAEVPDLDDHNFDLTEATIASACLANEPDFCARTLCNRPSLWSMGEDYPGAERPSRYERVFRNDRPARMVWRAVQTQRIHVQLMRNRGKTEIGVRKDFFENARWVLLNAVFVKVKPQYGDEMWLSSNEKKMIIEKAQLFSDLLWVLCEEKGYVKQQLLASGEARIESPRHLRSVFSCAEDCRQLRGMLLAQLAGT